MAANDNGRAHPALSESKVDEQLQEHIELYSGGDETLITERIFELDQEWDLHRTLQLSAALATAAGICLGLLVNRKWLALSGIAAGFLAQQSVQGWCPPLPLLRRFGYRTRQEIDKEKYALKALRGDFRRIGHDTGKAWKAVHD